MSNTTPQSAPCPITEFGPAALIKGENASVYNELLARVSGRLRPSDIFEEIWTREIVDLVWEADRWRQYLAKFLNSAVAGQLESMLERLIKEQGPRSSSFVALITQNETSQNEARKLARAWATGDPAAIENVEQLLATAGMTIETVRAQTIAKEIETVERFNRLIASAEGRRNGLLREIDRRRSLFAQRLRREVQEIEQTPPEPEQIEHEETTSSPAPEPERRTA
jgi:hypothetical protein